MSDINQNVNINVNANTQDAGQDINKLENNIKTLDGAVNLVGGSIEVLAGGLALAGAVTEEQAEKFQTAAVGAIALADGSKRLLEGYKTLATETNVVAKAQKALNFVMKMNPLGLVLIAATALAGAYLLLRNRTDAATEAAKRSRTARLAELDAIDDVAAANLRLARAKGAGEEDIKKAEIEAIERNLERLKLQRQELQNEGGISKGVIKNAEEIAALGVQQRDQRIQLQAAEIELQTIIDNNAKKIAEDREKERLENTNFSEEKIELKKKEIGFEVELRGQYTLTANTQMSLEKQKTEVTEAEAAKRKAIADAEEEYKQLVFTEGIDNIQGALAALFGENKAIASANVLIDAAQAGVGIIKNSQTTGPFAIAYQATQFALLTATTLASLRQINSAEPGSAGGAPNTPKGGGGLPTTGGIGVGNQGGRPQIGGQGFGSGVTAINAVVLSGEVTSAQAQDAAIRNRRRFG